MVEAAEAVERRRSPSVRYPGATLARVAQVVGYLDEVGGTASLGAIASHVGLSETNADFVRLVASARSYGLADWGNPNRSSLRLTADGALVAQGEADERQQALARAFLRPALFARIARKFEGRGLPAGAAFIEPIKLEGVAASAAPLAAKNFVESAQFAGVVEDHNGRQVLSTDLPYPTDEGDAGAGPAPAVRVSARPTQAVATQESRRAPRAPTAEPMRPTARQAGSSGPTVEFTPAVNINVQIHIAADASPATVEEIFKNMSKYVLGRTDGAADVD